ncbi:MAG: RidA family protein [Coriobacteriia bacterium]|nr:RidA family protein [Coriobacteriia bacterium]
MNRVAESLAHAGFALPDAPSAVGMYAPAVRAGSLVFTSGQLPFADGVLISVGKVGATVSEEDARACARQAALNALAAASLVCDLDDVCSVARLAGYVSSERGFIRQPSVVDGASEVLHAAFGEAGVHAREAVGVVALPLDAPVEVSLTLVLHEAHDEKSTPDV